MALQNGTVIEIYVTTASSTGAFHNIAPFVRSISGLNIEAMLQETHGFGESWVEQSYVGMRRVDDITIGGYYDDVAASGPHAIFGALAALGAERVIKFDFGTTNEYPKVDVVVKNYRRTGTVGEFTGYEVVLAPTGAVTYGAT